MKRVLLVLLVFGTTLLFGKGNYLMVFYPSSENCTIEKVLMVEYDVTTNSYGKKLKKQRQSFTLQRDRFGNFEFLQAPYLSSSVWEVKYEYSKKGLFSSWEKGRTKRVLKRASKSVLEGEATIYLPCSGFKKIVEKGKDMLKSYKE